MEGEGVFGELVRLAPCLKGVRGVVAISLELGRPLLQEGGDALFEVLGRFPLAVALYAMI